MKHGSLFSGIGGFDLAAQWMGWENVFQVEIDEYCRKVLTKNFPNTNRHEDIKKFSGHEYTGSIDIISGGFPCQPFSAAGRRKGTNDDRHLWPEMLRVISEVKPAWVVGENVAGLLSMENGETLERIFTDLEDQGYTVEPYIIPACGVGAWHRRDRLWIVAYSTSNGCRGRGEQNNGTKERKICESEEERTGIWSQAQGCSRITTNSNSNSIQGVEQESQQSGHKRQDRLYDRTGSISTGEYWKTEPGVGRVVDGVSTELDENLKYYENTKGDYQEAIATADKFRRKMLQEMWFNQEFTEASPRIYGGWDNNSVPEMSHRGTYERWLMGKGIKEDEKVYDMWKEILSKPLEETQDMQQELLEQIRKIECKEKVAKNRVDRIKGLGNAIVPQVVYQIFKAIEETFKP